MAPLLELKNVSKAFGGLQVISNLDLHVNEHEADYVRAVTASVSRLVVEGFIVKEDGDELIADALRQAPELVR